MLGDNHGRADVYAVILAGRYPTIRRHVATVSCLSLGIASVRTSTDTAGASTSTNGSPWPLHSNRPRRDHQLDRSLRFILVGSSCRLSPCFDALGSMPSADPLNGDRRGGVVLDLDGPAAPLPPHSPLPQSLPLRYAMGPIRRGPPPRPGRPRPASDSRRRSKKQRTSPTQIF